MDTPRLTSLRLCNQPLDDEFPSSEIAAISTCTLLKELHLPGYASYDDLSALAPLPLERFSCIHGFLLLALLRSGSLHTLEEVHVCCIFSNGEYLGNKDGLDPSSNQEFTLLLSEALLRLPKLQLLGHSTDACDCEECREGFCADVELAAMHPGCWRRIDRPGAEYCFRRVR